jgi:3-hydroxyacyl-CoA dehydrogenase
MKIGRVGLIGAGLMGHGIGKNILAKGYELVVMAHRNRAPVDDLIARGATERASAREVSTADIRLALERAAGRRAIPPERFIGWREAANRAAVRPI